MKAHYDKQGKPTTFKVDQKVWTPKTKKRIVKETPVQMARIFLHC